MLLALDFQLGPTFELVLAGDTDFELVAKSLKELRRQFIPNKVLVIANGKSADQSPLLQDHLDGKSSAAGEPILYVCEGFTCQEPAKGAAAVTEEIKRLASR
jgi:uncharacterized protein YyaL (SSP411 family)